MLTLEQVSAVNDGFRRGDLNAALAPLEETIDLRAGELPRLDKKAVAALKEGLANGDDAATWAQAIFHPNVSVRRFARKIFMGLGDEAAPVFAPLRARLERFWAEEKPLPESMKSGEAAVRRAQYEQIESALELLLRADPERFLEFYAQLSDNAPVAGDEKSAAMQKWQERNRAAWAATQKETDRLLLEEWGEKFAQPTERWKLPSRVLRELDERARARPEIARLWAELGENPWQEVAPEWNSTELLLVTWNRYLNDHAPTGPTRRINDRLRPVILNWAETALDLARPVGGREKFARRLMQSYSWHQLGGWLGLEAMGARGPVDVAGQAQAERGCA